MNFVISFPLGSFGKSAEALQLIHPFIRTDIRSIMSPRSYSGGYASFQMDEAYECLDRNGDSNFLLSSEEVEGDEDRVRIVFNKHIPTDTEYFSVKLGDVEEISLRSLMERAGAVGMSFAYQFDFWKSYWQSVELVNTFEFNKRPYAHLKTYREPGLPALRGHKVDISENPGHSRLTYRMDLMAAPEMWFGPGAWEYFDRKRVCSFPELQSCVEWENEVLYVKLFDWREPDYETEEILGLQRRFREWSGMNEAERALQDKLGKRY